MMPLSPTQGIFLKKMFTGVEEGMRVQLSPTQGIFLKKMFTGVEEGMRVELSFCSCQ